MNLTTTRTTRVRDVMTRNPICVEPGLPARELGETLDDNEISGAPVVDGADRLIGVVSKSDLIHRCVEELFDDGEGTVWSSVTRRAWEPYELGVVSDFMSTDPVTARPEERLADVAARMADRRVHRVVVTDDDACVIGILTTMDLIRIMAGPVRCPRPSSVPTMS